jgi:hypothetical protein
MWRLKRGLYTPTALSTVKEHKTHSVGWIYKAEGYIHPHVLML